MSASADRTAFLAGTRPTGIFPIAFPEISAPEDTGIAPRGFAGGRGVRETRGHSGFGPQAT